MGTQQEATEPGEVTAGAVRAVVTMAVIAVVSVALVVGWARFGRAGDAGGDVPDEGVPSVMAGGRTPDDVPAAVRAAFDRPVVGVATVDALPQPVLEGCAGSTGLQWDAQPRIETAHATPDGLHAVLVGDGGMREVDHAGGEPLGDRFRVVCTARHDGAGWTTDVSSFAPVARDAPFEDGGSSMSCCEPGNIATATASVQVPDDASWALQDRGEWLLGYPVEGGRSLTVTWKFVNSRFGGAGPQSRVIFVDRFGDTVGEEFVGGGF